jgi:hypothetical protein
MRISQFILAANSSSASAGFWNFARECGDTFFRGDVDFVYAQLIASREWLLPDSHFSAHDRRGWPSDDESKPPLSTRLLTSVTRRFQVTQCAVNGIRSWLKSAKERLR